MVNGLRNIDQTAWAFSKPVVNLGILVTALLLLLPASAQAQAPDTPPTVPGGRALWNENCLPCHGPAGAGDGPTAQAIDNEMPNFTDPDAARQMVPVESFDVIKNGRIENLMPPWDQRFDDEQMWDLTALVWYQGVPAENLATGQAIYAEQCAACHGDSGAGDGPEAAASMADLSNLEAMVQVSQNDLFVSFAETSERSDAHADLDALSEEELWQTLDYIRTFSMIVPQQNGVIRGQVINATTNEPVGGTTVTLRVFEGSSELDRLTVETDEAGRYSFENLSNDPTRFYAVEGENDDVTFQSDQFVNFTGDTSETTLDLNVYDTTTDPAGIALSQLHYVLAFTPDTLSVLQIWIVDNEGDRAYIGDEGGQTFAFTLPAEAENVAFQGDAGGARYVETEAGYADTEPILPGEEGLTILAEYQIPYNSDSLTVDIPLPADVAAVNLLLADQGVSLESEQLRFAETRQIQEDTFAIFNGRDVRQAEGLILNFSDLDSLEFQQQAAAVTPPGAATASTTHLFDQTLATWIILGLGLAAIAAVVVYTVRQPVLEPQAAVDTASQRQRLLLLLARLDEAFERGELNEAVYRRARARYKGELARVITVQ